MSLKKEDQVQYLVEAAAGEGVVFLDPLLAGGGGESAFFAAAPLLRGPSAGGSSTAASSAAASATAPRVLRLLPVAGAPPAGALDDLLGILGFYFPANPQFKNYLHI